MLMLLNSVILYICRMKHFIDTEANVRKKSMTSKSLYVTRMLSLIAMYVLIYFLYTSTKLSG